MDRILLNHLYFTIFSQHEHIIRLSYIQTLTGNHLNKPDQRNIYSNPDQIIIFKMLEMNGYTMIMIEIDYVLLIQILQELRQPYRQRIVLMLKMERIQRMLIRAIYPDSPVREVQEAKAALVVLEVKAVLEAQADREAVQPQISLIRLLLPIQRIPRQRARLIIPQVQTRMQSW